MPTADEWKPNTEIAMTESDPAGCETKKLREWVGIFCRGKGGAKGVRLTRGREAQVGAVPGQASLIAPVITGQDLLATFVWEGSAREFVIKADGAPAAATMGFSKPLAAAPAGVPGPGAEAAEFCACYIKKHEGKVCSAANAIPDASCARTYAGDCDKLLDCSAGAEAAKPTCAEGEVNVGAAWRCAALCETDVQCKQGHCADWQGGKVCL
jgi:hypothetical protein